MILVLVQSFLRAGNEETSLYYAGILTCSATILASVILFLHMTQHNVSITQMRLQIILISLTYVVRALIKIPMYSQLLETPQDRNLYDCQALELGDVFFTFMSIFSTAALTYQIVLQRRKLVIVENFWTMEVVVLALSFVVTVSPLFSASYSEVGPHWCFAKSQIPESYYTVQEAYRWLFILMAISLLVGRWFRADTALVQLPSQRRRSSADALTQKSPSTKTIQVTSREGDSFGTVWVILMTLTLIMSFASPPTVKFTRNLWLIGFLVQDIIVNLIGFSNVCVYLLTTQEEINLRNCSLWGSACRKRRDSSESERFINSHDVSLDTDRSEVDIQV
mmetsp:Transcript_50386/g.57805  ORF Transcript_50386/g.57805 Transcript_50386/m.57805 type:complete len:336 (+) Transcript_50386:96-1103(+)